MSEDNKPLNSCHDYHPGTVIKWIPPGNEVEISINIKDFNMPLEEWKTYWFEFKKVKQNLLDQKVKDYRRDHKED